jgi:two-component system, OmpR family, catabolic regulation response regulator CreB
MIMCRKPFRPRELSARIRAILRRVSEQGAPFYPTVSTESASSGLAGSRHNEAEAEARQRSREAGANQPALSIDQQRKVILYFGERLTLSRYEFRLLEILASSPGRVYSRAQLMEAAWEEPEASMERTVDAHIKSLRSKLRQVRPEIDAIRTHRGFGYSLLEEL